MARALNALALVFLLATTTLAAPDPAVVGSWSAPLPLPVVPVHAHLLPNGKLLHWGARDGFQTDAYVWDPVTHDFTAVFNTQTNLFCAGHVFLPDGRLFAAGGHHNLTPLGEPATNLFDWNTNNWTRVADMAGGRWYPTSTLLDNGDVSTVSGDDINGNLNTLPEVYELGNGRWRPLSNAVAPLPLYPWMFLTAPGKVLYAGPDAGTQLLNIPGAGGWTPGPASHVNFRGYGSAVMYGPNKILIAGGSDPATNTAEVIDLNAPTPVWRQVGSMAFSRRQMNATLLPDGTVLVTGGTSGAGFNNPCSPVLAAELWDPTTEAFTTLAAEANPRIYHSTAVLLPDGRVFSGGTTYVSGIDSGCPNTVVQDQANGEIFSPPYLFRGPRPTITGAPATVAYGAAFAIGTPDGARIRKVTWIRLSSVTHSFNQNQRINVLPFTTVSGGLQVTAPATADLAPPGHYMLFLVDDLGVPSVAAMVQLVGSAAPPTPAGSVTALPNPIRVCDASTTAATTLAWTTTAVPTVEIHADAPNGLLIATGGASGSAAASATNGRVFYLQNVSGGLPLTAANTLGTVAVPFTTSGCSGALGTISADTNPVPYCPGGTAGSTRLVWNSSNVTNVQVRSGAPNGPLFDLSGPGARSSTLYGITGDNTFFLQNVSGNLPLTAANTLASVAVPVTSAGCSGAPATGTLAAAPNPMLVCDGTNRGTTNLTWTTTNATSVEIHTGTPTGALVGQGGASGTVSLTNVTGGTTFRLQNTTGGRALTAANTLASVTVSATSADCPPTPVGSVSATPNPIQVCDGSGQGATTLSWTSNAVTAVELHSGSPAGPLLGSGGATGSAAVASIASGTVVYLQNTSGGGALTAANTLGTVTVSTTAAGCPAPASGSVSATPNPIQVCDGSGQGATTLAWTSTGTTTVELHSGSPAGLLLGSGGATGSASIASVASGTVVYLQNTSGGRALIAANTLGTVTVTTTSAGCPTGVTGSLSADPNPVSLCSGPGSSRLAWTSAGTTAVEIRTGAPNGPLFAASGSGAQSSTLYGIGGDVVFYLQDVSGGRPLTAANTLASVRIVASTAGCGATGNGTGTIVANPNPVCAAGAGGSTVLSWNSANTATVEVHSGAPAGPLFVRTGPGAYSTGLYWITSPMTFYLQDVSGGLPLTAANTLGSVTIGTTTACTAAPAIAPAASATELRPACAGRGLAGLECVLRTQLPPPECGDPRTAQALGRSVRRGLKLVERGGASAAHAERRANRVLRQMRKAIRAATHGPRTGAMAGCRVALDGVLAQGRGRVSEGRAVVDDR